jgi:hypothetical protein
MAAGLNTVSSPVVLVRPSEPVPPDVPQEAEERKNNARGRMTKRGREMWCITNYEVDSLSGDSEEESYREEVVYKERGRTLTKTEPITRMT